MLDNQQIQANSVQPQSYTAGEITTAAKPPPICATAMGGTKSSPYSGVAKARGPS